MHLIWGEADGDGLVHSIVGEPHDDFFAHSIVGEPDDDLVMYSMWASRTGTASCTRLWASRGGRLELVAVDPVSRALALVAQKCCGRLGFPSTPGLASGGSSRGLASGGIARAGVRAPRWEEGSKDFSHAFQRLRYGQGAQSRHIQ